jgi:lysozyme
MSSLRRINADGMALIKSFEGLRLKAYLCPADVWTIGYGSTKGVTKDTAPISALEGLARLKDDVGDAEDAIRRHVNVFLNQNQFDALVSFIFNLGEGNFKKSTLLKKINQGKHDQVPYELSRWNKVGRVVLAGLTRRRAAEALLWSTPIRQSIEPETNQYNIQRDVPSFINTENISAAIGLAGGVGASNLDGSNPIAWAIAIISVGAAAVFLYLFIKRRGA